MSVDIHVILEREKLVTPAEWQAGIEHHGFALELDTDFDPQEFYGFLPCRYQGQQAGFQYDLSELDPEWLEPSEVPLVGTRDTVLRFTTHGSLEDLVCAMIAASVLCVLTDGLLPEGAEEGQFIGADGAIAHARAHEAEIREAMQVQAAEGDKHKLGTGTRAMEINISHGDGDLNLDYLRNPRYHELRARQMAIFTERKGALTDEEFSELDEIDKELKELKGV